MTRLVLAATAVCLAITTGLASGQPTFRAAVDGVRVDVSVMNGLTPVAGLTVDHFIVADNGVPQQLDSVALDTVPLDLTLLLDTSESMEGERMHDLIDASQTLIKSLRETDAAAVMTFSEPVRFDVLMTRDRSKLLNALAGLKAWGYTSLNDAVFLAMQRAPIDASEARSVLLVFSDGQDSSSWLEAAPMLAAASRSRTLIHAVELIGSLSGSNYRTSETLGAVASAGGGRRWIAQSSRDLRELFGKVLNELRSRYLLTYTPKGVQRDGWHDVKVTLKGARGDVTARPGYFVAPR